MLPAALRHKQCNDWKPVHAFVALQPPPILSNTSKLCTHFRILADKILWTLQIYSMYFLHFLQGVQDSTVIPLHCTVCTPSIVKKKCKHWFTVVYCNIVMCMWNTCKVYIFYGCPTFHCNPTVLFIFDYCSKYSGKM